MKCDNCQRERHSYICQQAQNFEVNGKYGGIITRNFRKMIHEKFCLSRSEQSTTVKAFPKKNLRVCSDE